MQREAYLKRIVFLWQIRITLFSLPLLIIAFLINKFVFAAVLIFVLFLEVVSPIFLKNCKTILLNELLMFESGIIFKRSLIVPYKKIIYIKCFKTPLSSRLGLTLAVIKTVGGRIILPDIADDVLKELKLLIEEAAY